MAKDIVALGITIDEELTIGLGRLDGGERGFCRLGSTTIDPSNAIPSIKRGLKELVESYRTELSSVAVDSITVSALGLVDLGRKQIVEVALPDWNLGVKRPVSMSKVLAQALPIEFRPLLPTDRFEIVNDATAYAMGERHFGAGKNLPPNTFNEAFALIRVGGGINAGVLINGLPWRGGLHPEAGHIRVRKLNDFEGVCPFHKDCLEGLISIPALARQFPDADTLGELWRKHPEAKPLIAQYVTMLCGILTTTIAPECIVLAGSIIDAEIVDLVRKFYPKEIQGYPAYGASKEKSFIRLASRSHHANMEGVLEIGVRKLARGPSGKGKSSVRSVSA